MNFLGRELRATVPIEEGLARVYWRSLRYFTSYRLAVAGLLLTALFVPAYGFYFERLSDQRGFVLIAFGYLLFSAAAAMLAWSWPRAFNWQLSAMVAIDIACFTALMAVSGGVRSGVGVLLMVTLAGAGLVGQGRLVLLYAALATLSVLIQQVFLSLRVGVDEAAFFNAGVFCVGFFATAITARLLASRVVAHEELARRRGLELQREAAVREMVIAQMHDGVLVVSANGAIRQGNPQAWNFLGAAEGERDNLALVAPGLAQQFEAWKSGTGPAESEFRGRGEGRQIHARFVPTGAEAADALIFLEDVGAFRQQAQQLKLAALGRLTASIAHEIRNPLNAMRQSAELLREELPGRDDALTGRLLRILLDNTSRLEEIVQDVMALGRRDKVHREILDVDKAVREAIDDVAVALKISSARCHVMVDGAVTIAFDRGHFAQVMRNLVENAIRHSPARDGSVTVRAAVRTTVVVINIIDTGEGIPDGVSAQVFEPFFTTHAKGTGLGLFIARQLCEANGARLDFIGNAPGAHFRIEGGTR